jgi:hypothetical protein
LEVVKEAGDKLPELTHNIPDEVLHLLGIDLK